MTMISLVFSLAATVFITYGDLHTDDTGIVVGLIALSSFFAAAIQPKGFWRWALIIGAGVPIANRSFLIGAVTMAVAFAGATLGSWISRTISRSLKSRPASSATK